MSWVPERPPRGESLRRRIVERLQRCRYCWRQWTETVNRIPVCRRHSRALIRHIILGEPRP